MFLLCYLGLTDGYNQNKCLIYNIYFKLQKLSLKDSFLKLQADLT